MLLTRGNVKWPVLDGLNLVIAVFQFVLREFNKLSFLDFYPSKCGIINTGWHAIQTIKSLYLVGRWGWVGWGHVRECEHRTGLPRVFCVYGQSVLGQNLALENRSVKCLLYGSVFKDGREGEDCSCLWRMLGTSTENLCFILMFLHFGHLTYLFCVRIFFF